VLKVRFVQRVIMSMYNADWQHFVNKFIAEKHIDPSMFAR